MSLGSISKHLLHCVALFSTIAISWYINRPNVDTKSETPHALLIVIALYLQQYMFLFFLPIAAFYFLGLVFFNAFQDDVKIVNTSKRPPFVCVRTVTRGLYPELVLENVTRNMRTCFESGLEDFVIEVVTDISVNLPHYPRLREIVVPTDYKTRNGTLFKARALQYCLEEGVDLLSDKDWIVHLDEETIMTPRSVRGIINFIQQDKHLLGQGLITYANERVDNWLTTLADTQRVAEDLGLLRFQLRGLHRLFLAWKGSFLVTKASVERKITFDHGPMGSITEDINFGFMSVAQGYSFDFIEGEMWEKSTLTVMDYIKQRARWCLGGILVTRNPNVPFRAKYLFTYCTWLSLTIPFVSPTFLLPLLYPMAQNALLCFMRSTVISIFTYTFFFGILRSFSLAKMGIVKYSLAVLFSIAILPLIKLVLDCTAIIRAIFTRKMEFYIVQKKTTGLLLQV